MIDIHTHILPSMDDGSKSIEESIQMAKIAAESGVHTLVATPHCNIEGRFDNYYNEVFEERFQAFAKAVQEEQIPLQVMPGMEVFATEEVPELLKEGKLITLNHSRYLLMEFSFREDLSLTQFLINEVTSQGCHPIIAHPERYPYVQRHPEMVYEWLERGCFLQVNKGSILGSFGSRPRITSLILLEHNLVSFIASDAHSSIHRTTSLSEVSHIISNYFSKEYADIIMEENPKRVVEDKELLHLHTLGAGRRRYS